MRLLSLRVLALTLSLGAAATAGAISRVGNSSIVDEATRFRSDYPAGFAIFRALADGSALELQTPPRFSWPTGEPRSYKLRLQRFERLFPDLVNLSAENIREVFLAQPEKLWWELRTADDCLLGFASEEGSLYQVVTTWGGGRGLVLLGEKDPDVQRGMREILRSMRLGEGACAWALPH